MTRTFRLAIPALLGLLMTGCGPQSGSTTPGSDVAKSKAAVDPWPLFVSATREQTDPKACRKLLADLNVQLGSNPTFDQPKKADTAEFEILAKELNLTPREREFLAQAEYQPLDGHVLSDALFFRTAMSALGLQPADTGSFKAQVVFDWVCRHMMLHAIAMPPVPPSYAVIRGSGTGLERASVFMAACQQLGLETYLVGNAAQTRLSTYNPDGDNANSPRGPFWAVGVRVDEQVLLFDPWRGTAVASATPNRVATLAEMRTNPEALPNPPNVSVSEMKAAELSVSLPLSAFAPRMLLLQDKLEKDSDVKLYADWPSLVKNGTGASAGAAVLGWNPAAEQFSPVRILSSFLPVSQGGINQELNGHSPLFGSYMLNRLPRMLVTAMPKALPRSVVERLQQETATIYDQSFLASPNAHEKILRGDIHEATRDLVDRRDRFNAADERRRGSNALQSPTFQSWLKSIAETTEAMTLARLPENSARRPEVEAQLAQLWKSLPPSYIQLQEEILAPIGLSEATVELAVAAQERAEIAEVAAQRTEQNPASAEVAKQARTKARAEWTSAVGSWKRVSAEAIAVQEEAFPGRQAHIGKLIARAAERAAIP